MISLVESLIRGLPIPPIYTSRNDRNQLEILDGQQRILSLFFYYIGYYLDRKKNNSVDFSEIEIEGKSFKEALKDQFAYQSYTAVCLSHPYCFSIYVRSIQSPPRSMFRLILS